MPISLRVIWIFCLFPWIVAAEGPYYVIFLVNARHLDYSNCSSLLKTIAKHPSDGSKNGDVGHAWILLHGDGEQLEGGHSGERGVWQPRYWEGVLDNIYQGSANPVSYLWCTQCDGFFQQGNGGHLPTYAAKVGLTRVQYEKILQWIAAYPFQDYAITGKQCASFVSGVAEVIGIQLETEVELPIAQWIYFDRNYWLMWSDPHYCSLRFGSPDRLERSLKALVKRRAAEDVTSWYRRTHRKCWGCRTSTLLENFTRYRERVLRYRAF